MGTSSSPVRNSRLSAASFPESINNSDLISGKLFDAAGVAHGFIAYPNVVLPVTSQSGAFVFDVAISPNTPVFLDPVPAVGYQYAVGAGNAFFASVTLPIGVGDNVYTLIARGSRGSDQDEQGECSDGEVPCAFTLAAGQRFDFAGNGFPGGVGAFEVLGIEISANLDPENPRAFVTEVTFGLGGNGRFTGTMTPMTVSDELVDLRTAVKGLGPGKRLVNEVRKAEKAYAAGLVPEACAALADLVSDLRAMSGKQLCSGIAPGLVAQARAVAEAVGCR